MPSVRKLLPPLPYMLERDGNLLEEKPENCQVLKINNPILTNTDLLKIKNMKVEGFKVVGCSDYLL